MRLHCPRVQALFPREDIRLEHQGPAWMLWTEHGGSLILKVENLKFGEITAAGEESGLFLELELPPVETLVPAIEGFAARHNLPLTPPASPAPARLVRPILAACHLPEQNKFIFAEDARLEARPGKDRLVEIAVRGDFRARALPCREADLVMHFAPGELAPLVDYLLALARAAR